MSLTTDPNDPRLKRGGADSKPVGMQEVYLVLSAEERARGFVRPVRSTYKHVGVRPQYPVRDLTEEELTRYAQFEYVQFEPYPESESPVTGRYWTRAQLESGCGAATTMGRELAETYARDPKFYGATYCVGCKMHRPVGEDGEFVWEDGTRVGT